MCAVFAKHVNDILTVEAHLCVDGKCVTCLPSHIGAGKWPLPF